MRKTMGNCVLGSGLLFLAVVLFIFGAQNVLYIQRELMLNPSAILPHILTIIVPSVLFMIAAILAFKGELTISYKSRS